MAAPANTDVTAAAHPAKYGATLTITCQEKDGIGSAPGDVALAGRVITMNVSREFALDSVGTQDGDIVMSTNTVGTTDATGLVTFTVAGPADPSTTADSHIDTIVLTCADACNAGTATTGNSGFMTDGGLTLTHTQVYLDTTPDAASTVVTGATTGLASTTTGISRLVTATVYDQYGDTVAGETVDFMNQNDLPGGLVCTAAAPSVCTSLAAHGLADGDTLIVVEDTNYNAAASVAVMASDGGGGALAVLDLLCVGTVNSTVEFILEGVDANSTTDYGCGSVFNTDGDTASSTAAPLFVAQTNSDGFTAAVSRVTSSAGTASYSWNDKHGVSGKNLTRAAGQSGTSGSHTFYRLDAAADFTEAGDDDETLSNGDTVSMLVEWDGTNDDFTIAKLVAAAATHPIQTFMQYNFDANDHFVTGAELAEGTGTTSTMAAWETAMAGNVSVPAIGAMALIDYEPLSTGISQFSEGDD